MTQPSDPLPPGLPPYPGEIVQRPDGTLIGMRDFSKCGGPTIDIKYPDGSEQKVHVSDD